MRRVQRLASVSALVLLPALVSAQTEVVEIPAPSLAGARFQNPSHLPILVHRPPGYDGSTARFPVVYYLPGFTTDATEYVDGTFDGLHAGRLLDALFADTGAPFLLVVVHGRNALGGSFYVDSPVTGNWEQWVAHDVVTYVDAHYRTL
ncbi:esterase family protein, partial [bacterium]|nr:esterase family protein [bacterium]